MEEGADGGGCEMGEGRCILIITTAPPGDTDRIAQTLVEEHLAACVSVMPVRSHFIWDGRLSRENEEMLFVKTTSDAAERARRRILELHSYQLPEIIALEIADGHEPYLRWIQESVR